MIICIPRSRWESPYFFRSWCYHAAYVLQHWCCYIIPPYVIANDYHSQQSQAYTRTLGNSVICFLFSILRY